MLTVISSLIFLCLILFLTLYMFYYCSPFGCLEWCELGLNNASFVAFENDIHFVFDGLISLLFVVLRRRV